MSFETRIATLMAAGLFVATLLLPACASEDTCVWGVDDLLAEVNVAKAKRLDCGNFNGYQTDAVSDGLECFLSAPKGKAAQLVVNACTDCLKESTYVSTEDGEIFHVTMEADQFGDDQREAKVEQCGSLAQPEVGRIQCVKPEGLYSCQDALH